MKFIASLTPDPIDPRDHIFEWEATAVVPASVDLRDYTGMVENQLSIGSCTANATVSACEMFLIANGELVDTPDTDAKDLSRLFNYYWSRHNIGGLFSDNDVGSTARESLRSARNQGICYEVTWPYQPFGWNNTPSDVAYMEASLKTVGEYARIEVRHYPTFQDMNPIGQIKYALAQGYPVLVGMTVGERLRSLTPDGADGCYRYNTANLFPLCAGAWGLAAGAGVFYRNWFDYRSYDDGGYCGFRAGAYGS